MRQHVRTAMDTALDIQVQALRRDEPARVERMRPVGRCWAEARMLPGDIVPSLGDLVSHLVNTLVNHRPPVDPTVLAAVVTAGTAIVHEFMHGFREAAWMPGAYVFDFRRELTMNLLTDRPTPADGPIPVAASYGLCSLHCRQPIAVDEATAIAQRLGGDGACSMLNTSGGVVLLPAEDVCTAATLAKELHEQLGDECWVAVAWRPRGQLAEAWHQARRVVSLVTAGRPPGTYSVLSVLTEYAAAENPMVSAELIDVIQRLAPHPVLMDTLTALLTADGNRTLAATNLHIHRSTLDYRLRRITQLTGQSPTTPQGLHTLATARTLYLIDGAMG